MHSNVVRTLLATLIVVPIAFYVGFSLTAGELSGHAIVGMILTTITAGVLVLGSSKRFVIEPNQVRALGPFGMGGKTMPIDGLGDLVFDGTKIKRRSDGKVVARISALDNAEDRAALQAALPSA